MDTSIGENLFTTIGLSNNVMYTTSGDLLIKKKQNQMSETIQKLYDELRECDEEIQAGKQASRRKKEIHKELKLLEIDLVKKKKLHGHVSRLKNGFTKTKLKMNSGFI